MVIVFYGFYLLNGYFRVDLEKRLYICHLHLPSLKGPNLHALSTLSIHCLKNHSLLPLLSWTGFVGVWSQQNWYVNFFILCFCVQSWFITKTDGFLHCLEVYVIWVFLIFVRSVNNAENFHVIYVVCIYLISDICLMWSGCLFVFMGMGMGYGG